MPNDNIINAIDAVVNQDQVSFKDFINDALRQKATAEVEDRVGHIQNTSFAVPAEPEVEGEDTDDTDELTDEEILAAAEEELDDEEVDA